MTTPFSLINQCKPKINAFVLPRQAPGETLGRSVRGGHAGGAQPLYADERDHGCRATPASEDTPGEGQRVQPAVSHGERAVTRRPRSESLSDESHANRP